jgi:hypothetical protein
MEFESCAPYYGFIDAEFLQWWLSDAGHLIITTLGGHYIYIAADKWSHKRSLLRADKILLKLPYNGSVFAFEISVNPVRERTANEALFRAGKNGPLNLSMRKFSEIFKPEHEQIDPYKCWPFAPAENEAARGIAKTAISLAASARGNPVLTTTAECLRGGTFAWMDVFTALNTYAIFTNSLEGEDSTAITRALMREFPALGFCTVWGSFFEFSSLLIEMKKRSGTFDLYALGSWALSKAAYGSYAYPKDAATEAQKEVLGTELRDYLGLTAMAITADGNVDWAHQ